MILDKKHLQTAEEWTKSYIELIASYVRAYGKAGIRNPEPEPETEPEPEPEPDFKLRPG